MDEMSASDRPGVPPRAADLSLVQRTLAREPDAVDRFIDRMRCVPRMLAMRNRDLGSPLASSELADLAQDTVCAILKRLPSYDGRASLETWAFRFCHFELLRVLRERERIPARLADPDIEPAHPSEKAIDDAVDFEQVMRAVDELDPSESDVIRAKHFDGLTFAEIAGAARLSVNTVKTRYFRGLLKLRHRLASKTVADRTGGSP